MALRIVIGDVTIGIQGQEFAYIFSVGMGGMESLYKEGKEWLYRAPRPAFWRAATDNDKGNGFAFRSAVWSAADRFVRCVKVTARMDEQEISMPPAPENNKYNGAEICELSGGSGRTDPCTGGLFRKTGSAGAAGIWLKIFNAHRRRRLYLRGPVRRDLSGSHGRGNLWNL